MGKVALNLAEKGLLKHLCRGGRPDDDIGRELIWKFATKVWNDSSVTPILHKYDVTIDEVAKVYLVVIDSLMPAPWMNVSGPMLVPTQWYMEPPRIEHLLAEATRKTAGMGREEWLAQWITSAQGLAHATRDAHDERYGPPNIQLFRNVGGEKSAGGCAGKLLVALVVAIAISAVVSVFF